MRLPRLICAAALAAIPASAQTPDPGFFGGAKVRIALGDVAGVPIDMPVAGQPFRVLVQLSDPGTDRPVTDEHLSGWIRPVEASNGQCRDAARANTISGDNLPRGTTDLARSLYGVRHDDGTVSIVDWEHSLASANILAMIRLPDASGPIAALPDDFAFAVTTQSADRFRIDAAAGAQPQPMATLAGAGPVLTTPQGWVAQGEVMRAPNGTDTALPAPALAIQPAIFDIDDGRYRGAVALTKGGAAIVAERGMPATAPVQGPAQATSAAYAYDAGAMLFADGSDRLTVNYGGRRTITAPLPAPANRISASPEGELALAWSTGSSAVSIIDIATASLVQAVDLNRPPLNQPIREIAFAQDAAFLALEDLDFVVVLDLQQARRGEAAAARPVRIGPAVENLPADAGPFLLETARGHNSETVLALHPGLSTAFPVKRESGNATAPMNGFRIAGARPLAMAELAGGLIEAAPGKYRTATVLAQGGPHELIVTAGPGRFSDCLQFDVDGKVQDQLALRLSALPRKQPGVIDLQLIDADGLAQIWPADMPLILQSLDTGWRQQAVARRQPSGMHRMVVVGSPHGLLSVALNIDLPDGLSIAPTTIELAR